MATSAIPLTGERGVLLQIVAEQRATLLITVRGTDDPRAAEQTTVSELTLGGLVKHLTRAERVIGRS